MGAPPADSNSASHSRNTSHDRPTLSVQQPDPQAPHVAIKGNAPRGVLKKKSADEHTALLASQREEYGDPYGHNADQQEDYFGDEEDWQETKSTWYMILLTLAIGG